MMMNLMVQVKLFDKISDLSHFNLPPLNVSLAESTKREEEKPTIYLQLLDMKRKWSILCTTTREFYSTMHTKPVQSHDMRVFYLVSPCFKQNCKRKENMTQKKKAPETGFKLYFNMTSKRQRTRNAVETNSCVSWKQGYGMYKCDHTSTFELFHVLFCLHSTAKDTEIFFKYFLDI